MEDRWNRGTAGIVGIAAIRGVRRFPVEPPLKHGLMPSCAND
jgi:hypothetical protein